MASPVRPRDRRLLAVPRRVRQGGNQQGLSAGQRPGKHRRHRKNRAAGTLVLCPPESQCAGRAAVRSRFRVDVTLGAGSRAHAGLVGPEPGRLQRQPAGAARQLAQFRGKPRPATSDGRGGQCLIAPVGHGNRGPGRPAARLGRFPPVRRPAAGRARIAHAQETRHRGGRRPG